MRKRRQRILAAILLLASFDLASGADGKPVKKKPYVVSRETTYLTGPLREDGTIDYTRAFVERMRRGLTIENNAASDLWRAWGPLAVEEEERDSFFRALGIEALPESGDYLVRYADFVEAGEDELDEDAIDEDDKVPNAAFDPYDQQEWALENAWTRERLPLVARWIDANAKPLRRVQSALARSRYYSPVLIQGDALLFGDSMPELICFRETAQVLLARALLHLGENRAEKAIEDLLATRRLARLLAQDPRLISRLVALAIDGRAMQTAGRLLVEARWTPRALTSFRRRFSKFTALTEDLASVMELERLGVLNAVSAISSGQVDRASFELIVGDGLPEIVASVLRRGTIDGSESMRIVNRWFDRLVEAYSERSFRRRRDAIERLDEELKRVVQKNSTPLRVAGLVLSKEGRTTLFSENLVSLTVPSIGSCARVFAESAARSTMIELAFEIEEHRLESGSLPATLVDLGREKIRGLELDPLSGTPIQYERRDSGYLLLCSGFDGERELRDATDEELAFIDELDHGDDVFLFLQPRSRKGEDDQQK